MHTKALIYQTKNHNSRNSNFDNFYQFQNNGDINIQIEWTIPVEEIGDEFQSILRFRTIKFSDLSRWRIDTLTSSIETDRHQVAIDRHTIAVLLSSRKRSIRIEVGERINRRLVRRFQRETEHAFPQRKKTKTRKKLSFLKFSVANKILPRMGPWCLNKSLLYGPTLIHFQFFI